MYIIPKEITNKIGREIFMPRQKWQRELEEAIDSFSPGDALEAVRIEAQLEEIELAEEKMGHNQVSAQHDGCWLCERKYSLQQKRAKLSENTGTKP